MGRPKHHIFKSVGQGGTAADKEDARGRDKRIGILRHMSICARVFRRVPQTTVKTRDGRSRYEREGETERERGYTSRVCGLQA